MANTTVIVNRVSILNKINLLSNIDSKNLLVKIDNNRVILAKSNNYESFKTTISFQQKDLMSVIETTELISINFDKFKKVISKLSSESLELTINSKENIVLKTKKSKIKLDYFGDVDVTEFKSNNTIETNSTINVENIISYLRYSLHSVSSSKKRNNEAISGINIKIIDNIAKIVSTDTRRLTILELTLEDNNDNIDVIIHKNTVKNIINNFNVNDKIEMKVVNGSTRLVVSNGEEIYESQLINDNFPFWEKIDENVKKNPKLIIVDNKDEFIEAMDIASINKDEIIFNIYSSKIIKTSSFEKDSISLCSSVSNTNLDDDEVLKFAINSKFVKEFLNSFKTESFAITFSDNQSPLAFIVNEQYKEIFVPYGGLNEDDLTI